MVQLASSRLSFETFLNKLARSIGTQKSLLSGIAYTASYQPKTPKPVPKLLEDNKSWKKLIGGAEAYIASCLANKGKGVIKVFAIQIVDTSGGDTKAMASGKKIHHCTA
jgi:hypothetical protein